MNEFTVLLKSGYSFQLFTEKNAIGLWVWSSKQNAPQVLGFGKRSVLSTEIAMITKQFEGGEEHENL